MKDKIIEPIPEDKKRNNFDEFMKQVVKNENNNTGFHKSIFAEHTGSIKLGNMEVPCAVLNTKQRVISQREIVGILTGNKKGGFGRYLQPKNLQPYLPKKFTGDSWDQHIIKFNSKNRNKVAQGFLAEDLISICEMYLKARDVGVLLPSQIHLAKQSEILIRSFAKVGLVALIDEATGYQSERIQQERNALQKILDEYISKELASWEKTFPNDFYKEIFRLKEWNFDYNRKKPGILGGYTRDIIYSRLAPGVIEELERINPITEKGYRKDKHHHHLSRYVGYRKLIQHIYGVIALMKSSNNWKSFINALERTFPPANTIFYKENE